MNKTSLTPLEKEKLEEFRKKVEPLLTRDEHREDHFLIRWLLARDLDVDKAEEMLRKSLEWRIENKADGILDREEIPLKIRQRYMFARLGEDPEGAPIILLPAGRHDHRIMLEEFGLEKVLHWNTLWIERTMSIIEKARKKTGKFVFQYHEIIDLEGYSVRMLSYKPAIDYILQTQKMFDANYPEILKSITVINAPKIFPILFGFVKPLLTQQTLSKLQVFGNNDDKWIEYFKEKNFPLESFPPRWGGSLKGQDEHFCCQHAIWLDAPIPLRYFKDVEGEDEEGFRNVKVGARDKFKVELEIEEMGSRLEWKFQTEVHDISFGISFENEIDKDIPVTRITSQKEMQEGFILVKSKGKCTLIFDNKFSYTTPKSLRYRIDLIPPRINSN